MEAYNWNTITNRLITLDLFSYPILFMFWPPLRNWYGKLIDKKERAKSRQSSISILRQSLTLNRPISIASSFNEDDNLVLVEVDDRGVSDLDSSTSSSDGSIEEVPKKMQTYSPIGSDRA